MKSLLFLVITFLKYGAFTFCLKTKVITFNPSLLKQDQAVFRLIKTNRLNVVSSARVIHPRGDQ